MKTVKNPQLELAYDYVCHTNKNIYLTGKAGTGKTTFLHSIRDKVPKRMAVVAPTGVAAINAKGVTIHSLFQLPFGPLPPDKARQELRKRAFSSKKINLIKSLDLLIIDEISMVRADVLDAIDVVLRRYKNFRLPFGGVQLLMIGDLHQLPPVVKDQEWDILREHYQTIYFFGSLALQKTGIVAIELKHIYRQSDNRFIELLNKVRNNQMDQGVLKELNSRYQPDFQPHEEDGFITLSSHNSTAQTINQERLQKIPGLVRRFKATVEKKFPEHAYPTEEVLEFKVGAQVMFIKNDNNPERRFYNGKIGQITQIDTDEITVKCPDDLDEILVRRHEWENRKYEINPNTKEIEEQVIGTFNQFPLKLAWAITIHKSQGLTFEKVIIDAQAAFAHGQVYVALSRCKSFEGIVLLSQIQSRSVKTDTLIQSYSKENQEKEPTKTELKEAKRDYQQACIRELFDFSGLSNKFAGLRRAILENENSLQGNEFKEFGLLKTTTDEKVVHFALKFSRQLNNYFSAGPLPEQNEALQARLKKASAYFSEALKNAIIPACQNFQILSDNKAIKKQVSEKLTDLQREVYIKNACFEISETGFETSIYIKTKADAHLDFQQKQLSAGPSKSLTPKDIEHVDLYKRIRKWREEKADSLETEVYSILPTKALLEIVRVLPTSSEALKRIGKFGSKRIKEFGADILEMVNDYCAEKSIPTDQFQFASLKARPDTKKISFESFKSGKSIQEIAADRGLTYGTIQNHLGHYVGIGELDILEILDGKKVEKIVEYYSSGKSNRLNDAKSFFGDEASYDDLRLVYRYWEFLQKEEG